VRSGKENDAESWQIMQDWLLSLRKRFISTMLFHHSSRTGTARGTSKREDTLDTVIRLALPGDYQPSDACRFEVHFEKTRLSRGGESMNPFEAKYEVREGKGIWTLKSCERATAERVAALLTEGLTQRQIAAELNLSVSTVNKHAKRMRGGK
jgi:putative DNA primase/helicase